MSVPFFFIGLLSFVFFWFRQPSEKMTVLTPLLLLFLSTFFIVLTPGKGIVGQVSAGFHALAVGCMLSVIVRQLLLKVRVHDSFRRASNAAMIIILVLTFHNVVDLGRLLSSGNDLAIQSANPWGVVILLVVVIFTLNIQVALHSSALYDDVRKIILFFSLLFIVVDFLVVAGILPGNTQKITLGIGGKGLANISTNETGILGVSLLLWNLFFLFHEKKIYVLHAVAGIGALAMIIFTRSRVALGLALVLLFFYLLFSALKTRVKVAIFFPALLFMLLIAGNIIQERTESEGESDPNNPLTELPGSGRPLIWFYYLDAFIYTADSNPFVWLTGVGVVRLTDLYDLTPLPTLGLTLEKVSFYPLHSDLIKIFFVSGIIGLVAWLLIFYNLLRAPKHKDYRYLATAAIVVFIIFTSVDMLNYFPLVTMLLMLAVASSVERGNQSNEGEISA